MREDLNGQSFRPVPVNPQSQIDRLESKLDVLRAVLEVCAGTDGVREGAASEADPSRTKLYHYWRAIQMSPGLVLVAAFFGLLAGGLFTLTRTPLFLARSAIEIVGMNENFLNAREIDPVESRGYTSESYIQTQAETLKSIPLVEKVVAAFPPPPTPPAEQSAGQGWTAIRNALRLSSPAVTAGDRKWAPVRQALGNLRVQPRRGTRLIDIEYVARTPDDAASFVNRLAKEYTDYTLAVRTGTSRDTANLLNKEVSSLEHRLHESEADLEEFGRRKQILFTDGQATVQSDSLRNMQTELSKAQADRIVRQSRHEMAVSSSPEALPEVLDSPTLGEYYSKIAELQRQLVELRTTYGPDYYKIKRQEAQLVMLRHLFEQERQKVIERTRNEYETAVRRERLLTEIATKQGQLVSGQGKDVVSYGLLKGQMDTYKSLYDSMLQKAKAASLALAMRENTVRVLEPAIPPSEPFTPNLWLNCVVGVLSGLVLGIGLVIVRDQSDVTLRNPGDSLLHANLQELGVIPSITADPYLKTLRSPDGFANKLRPALTVTQRDQSQPARVPELAVWRHKPTLLAETYRALLTSILFSSRKVNKTRVLVMTSPGASEGKSTITSNLAVAMAEIKGSVLVIDADVRKPRIHQIFELPNDAGLTTHLLNPAAAPDEVMRLILPTVVPGLFVLPSGPQHGSVSALLHSDRLGDCLRLLRTRFDFILIDSPPVLQLPDARILARRADAALLVGRCEKTSRGSMILAKQRFEDDGIPVLGAILNDWRPRGNAGSAYYNPAYYPGKISKSAS